ncbi:MAG: LysE family transporter [Chloroflexi bacterium]|nr:LysE family transporter [Chloroflexota bacterium]
MDWLSLARAVILGFSIAAPVGPIGVLCIRRTLAHGRLVGFASGLGAATADAAYAAVAGLGLTAVSSLLVSQQTWLRLLGGGFLLYLGARTFVARPAHSDASAYGRGLAGAYASTVVLTLTNPPTILVFAALFAGLGLAGGSGDAASAVPLVLGIFLGSALWWLVLSAGASLLRARLTPATLGWVNRLSGVVIAGFGLVALLSLRG